MKVLVFGGSGFLGSYVVDELMSRGHEVSIYDLQKSPYRDDIAHTYIGNILDKEMVAEAINNADIVYHMAGQPDIGLSMQDPFHTIQTNVMGTTTILEALKEAKIKRFVFASTMYVFSDSGGFYGASKDCCERIVEEYAKHYNFDYNVMRYGSVYGERADAKNRIYQLLQQAVCDKKITFPGDGSEEREYIHAADAAALSVDILDASYKNQHFVLTGVEKYQYRELLNLISEIMGNSVEIEYQQKQYKGHYKLTPYSFVPKLSKKITANPGIDFAQGLLHCIQDMYDKQKSDPSDI